MKKKLKISGAGQLLSKILVKKIFTTNIRGFAYFPAYYNPDMTLPL
jgi:hypothetical protein